MSQSSFFAELAEVTKPAPSLRLVIEGVGALLGIGPQPMPTKHRVPPNSRYTPTVTLLAQDPDATLERLVSLDFSIVSNRAADALYGVVRHKSWSAADAAAQGAHLGELAELLVRVDAELAMTPGRKPVAATRVAVALDGSRCHRCKRERLHGIWPTKSRDSSITFLAANSMGAGVGSRQRRRE